MDFNIVLAQLKIGYGNLEEAFQDLQTFINQTKPLSRSLLILPEMWPSGFNREKLSHSISKSHEIQDRFKALASKHRIYIAVPIPLRIPTNTEKAFNSFICLSPEGKLIGEYHKLHLFPLTNERGPPRGRSAASGRPRRGAPGGHARAGRR